LKKLLARLVRQSPAMIVAMLALFVALTGTAVATTSALITGKQIANSSITGADVKNKSLTPRDFRGSVRGPRGLRGLTGAAGAPGAAGAKGDKGDKGDTGPPGPTTAAAASSDGDPDAAPYQFLQASTTITTPTSGKLFVTGSDPVLGVTCNASGQCFADLGIYVDGVAVPGTRWRVTSSASQTRNEAATVYGVASNIAAGAHTVQLRAEYSGNWSIGSPIGSGTVGAIALGG
jgi:hypothetical protein